MLIALLVVLGVDLIIVLLIVCLAIGRRRWLKRQPGTFCGAIRVSDGEVQGLGRKWKRGSGRWVKEVLVWSQAPDMFRSVVIPVDSRSRELTALGEKVAGLGKASVSIGLLSGTAAIEIAAAKSEAALATGPFASARPNQFVPLIAEDLRP